MHSFNQEGWASGGKDDREGDTSDDEHSSGWQNEGEQSHLQWGSEEAEPSLGWTEHLDQRMAGETKHDHWYADDGEEDAGDAPEADPAPFDEPGFIWGGNESGGPTHSAT